MESIKISDLRLLMKFLNVSYLPDLSLKLASFTIGTMSSEQAWKQYKDRLLERFKNDTTAPIDADALPEAKNDLIAGDIPRKPPYTLVKEMIMSP